MCPNIITVTERYVWRNTLPRFFLSLSLSCLDILPHLLVTREAEKGPNSRGPTFPGNIWTWKNKAIKRARRRKQRIGWIHFDITRKAWLICKATTSEFQITNSCDDMWTNVWVSVIGQIQSVERERGRERKRTPSLNLHSFSISQWKDAKRVPKEASTKHPY